jgi:hypothetical protein
VAITTPTHTITHLHTGTTANVSLAERIQTRLDNDLPLAQSDQRYVAIAFKNTQPFIGRSMAGEYVDFAALSIQRIDAHPAYGDAPVPLGPGGTVLDEEEGCDGECCRSCDLGYHDRCSRGNCPLAYHRY